MAKKGTRKKLPPIVEEARRKERRYEDDAVVAGEDNLCKNCGREGTLVTRVSCTNCGTTLPPS